MIKRWIDRRFARDIRNELEKIAPEVVQNPFGTAIVNAREEKIFWFIAHQRMITRMGTMLHIMALTIALLALWRTL